MLDIWTCGVGGFSGDAAVNEEEDQPKSTCDLDSTLYEITAPFKRTPVFLLFSWRINFII